MWGKIMIPMYRLLLHSLYRLYRPRCLLAVLKKAVKLNHSLTHSLTHSSGFILLNTKSCSGFIVSNRPLHHYYGNATVHVQGNTLWHYNDVIMGMIASQITSLTIVYSTVYSDADRRKHQSSATLASYPENVSIWWHHGIKKAQTPPHAFLGRLPVTTI